MKTNLLLISGMFILILSLGFAFAKQSCNQSNECMEIVCPQGGFAHGICSNNSCTMPQCDEITLVGSSCATVSPNSRHQCCIEKGFPEDNSTIDDHCANYYKNIKNMTFGQCTAEHSKIQKVCTKEVKITNKECRINANNQTDSKTAFQTCKSGYKKNINQCKATFKLGKTECGNLTKKRIA